MQGERSSGGPRRRAHLIAVRATRAATVALGLAGAAIRSSVAQPAQPAIPVTIAAASRADVPVYMRGIGTVQAFNAVTVRARVDGTLMEVKVSEGQEVKKGDLVAVVDPRPYQAALDAAMAKKAQDEAMLSNAQRDLTRYSSLAKQDFASHQQVDTQEAAVAQSTAGIKGDEAAIATAELNLSFCYILSPIDGRVGLRQIDPGNLVHANDPGGIINIAQLHPISLVFTLPQGDLPRILDAMAARTLPVGAYTGDDKTELSQGELLTPDNAIDTTTGTIKLKASFRNTDNRLWPGQFVNAHLLVDTRHDALTVPSPAIQHGPSGLYVYVVKPDQTAMRQDVEIEQDTGTVAVVSKGLSDGERVVVSGQSRLQNGSRIAEASAGAGPPSPPQSSASTTTGGT